MIGFIYKFIINSNFLFIHLVHLLEDGKHAFARAGDVSLFRESHLSHIYIFPFSSFLFLENLFW